MRRYNPGGVTGSDGHDAAGCEDDLIAIMKVKRHYVTSGIILNASRDMGAPIAQAIVNCGLTLSRHSLSQYREYADADKA